jgi:hypothetical protein
VLFVAIRGEHEARVLVRVDRKQDEAHLLARRMI